MKKKYNEGAPKGFVRHFNTCGGPATGGIWREPSRTSRWVAVNDTHRHHPSAIIGRMGRHIVATDYELALAVREGILWAAKEWKRRNPEGVDCPKRWANGVDALVQALL